MNKKKKLLYFVSEDWYFVSHRINLAKDAIFNGYDVTLITNVTDKKDEIINAGITVLPLNIDRAGMSIFKEMIILKSLIKLIKKENPDIIHNISIKPIIYGSFAGLFSKAKITNTFAGLGIISNNNSNQRALFRFIALLVTKILLKEKIQL